MAPNTTTPNSAPSTPVGDVVYFTTTNTSGISGDVRTTTGYARIVHPNGKLGPQFGDGDSLEYQGIHEVGSSTVDLAERVLGLMSVADGGAVASGRITHLELSYNELTSFKPLIELPSLVYLELSNNNLTSFEAPCGMPSLIHLLLRHNKLPSFEPLSELPRLAYLHLCDNELPSFRPLNGLPSLAYLYLSNNQFMSFTTPNNLPSLVHIDLDGNPCKNPQNQQ